MKPPWKVLGEYGNILFMGKNSGGLTMTPIITSTGVGVCCVLLGVCLVFLQ